MNRKLARTDKSTLSEWLWTVDHAILTGVVILIAAGLFLGLAASPPVAEKLNLDSFYFMRRQAIFLIPAVILLLGISMLSTKSIKRFGFLVCSGSIILVLLTLFFAAEIKGATRWLYIGPFSLQPSEFLKPGFVIVTATILSSANPANKWPVFAVSGALFTVCVGLLVLQPDFGQTFLLVAVWSIMLFLAGLPKVWIFSGMGLGFGGSYLAYNLVPHVQSRVDRFLNPETGDTYQIDRALDAFHHGGLVGQGLGEGQVKRILPDAHTDFIFAVAAEELGVIACLFLLIVFGMIVLRGLNRAFETTDSFVQLSVTGLITIFGLQAFVNMAVNMNLLPSKGMTLPFVSYGGSSLLALALTMGMVLALTRRGALLGNSTSRRTVRVRSVHA